MPRRLLATVTAGLLLAACTSADDAAPSVPATTQQRATTTSTTAPATVATDPRASDPAASDPAASDPAASDPAASTTATTDEVAAPVSVLGLWSGPELDSFETVAAAWEEQTGGTVDWHGAQDLASELDAQLRAGTPPDIAVLPNVGLLHELAAEGRLVPLASVLDVDQLRQDYAPAWLDLGSDAGELYGIVDKVTDKSTVWYSPAAFAAAGYAVPTTWDEWIRLADSMVADGRTPFSVVAPRLPGGGGWALTDWVSQIVLSRCGPETYDRWVAGEIPWTDACIAESFAMFGTIVHTPGYVRGGAAGIAATSDSEGSYPMYTDPPGAYMYYLASFAQAFIADRYPDLAPGGDYATFPFPTVDAEHAGAVTIGADIVVMLHDTPAARSFLAYLAGAESQRIWIDLGGFTSVNRSVPLDAYPDPVARAIAQHLATAELIRYSAGDLLPPAVQQAWWHGMLQYVQDPTSLDQVLATLTSAAGG